MRSFLTAKYWGKGPTRWTSDLISAKTIQYPQAQKNSPVITGYTESSAEHPSEPVTGPSPRCRYAIHACDDITYERIPSPERDASRYDIFNDSTWATWPREYQNTDIAQRMQENLEDTTFTNIPREDLPISVSSIAQVAQKSAKQLELEAWTFAIMAGNLDSVDFDIDCLPETILEIHPFHLAATYLDGGHGCCEALSVLIENLTGEYTIGLNNFDDNGHTVLDMLMISVLRSHTSVQPKQISDSFKHQPRFDGENKDICGRWDADSPCVRHLYASGAPRIPEKWKHIFCHTSVQAVCHSITAIFGVPWAPNVDDLSGLFRQQCNHCHEDLQLYPLHTLVIVTLYLANSGKEGETLFGSLAVLVCLLTHNANPTQQASISIPLLFGQNEPEDCDHTLMDAAALATKVPEDIISTWAPDTQLGWMAFVGVLKFATGDRGKDRFDFWADPTENNQHMSAECPCLGEEDFIPSGSTNFRCLPESIGTLWATIQTEYLTYRRASEGESWLSPNFDMKAVWSHFTEGFGLERMPLIQQGLMQEYSRCGWFYKSRDPFCPTAKEVSSRYFMNLGDWGRSRFIEGTAGRYEAWMSISH